MGSYCTVPFALLIDFYKEQKKFSYAWLTEVVEVVGWTKLLPTPLPISR